MPWKEELPSQGPAPSSSAKSKRELIDVEAIKEEILQKVSAQGAKIDASGELDVELAPISRFPWEVRIVEGNIRVYKGIVVNTLGGAYETRNSHIRVSGRSRNRIRIVGSRASGGSGNYDWISTVDQRDPYSVPPDGPGTQVAWPPFYVDGPGGDTIGTSRRDPEAKDGGLPFETFGSNIGMNGYGASGADGMPWFTFPFAVGPIYLSGRTNLTGDMEFGVFQNLASLDPAGWKVLIAHVSSADLIHQYFRSDVVYGGSGGGAGGPHPFMIECFEESGDIKATLTGGHVNNVVPSNISTVKTLTQNAINKVYLVVNKSGSNYPSTITWETTSSSSLPANDADKAHMLIGEVEVLPGPPLSFTIQQMVQTSLNTLRVKWGPGTNDIYYMFNRV